MGKPKGLAFPLRIPPVLGGFPFVLWFELCPPKSLTPPPALEQVTFSGNEFIADVGKDEVMLE